MIPVLGIPHYNRPDLLLRCINSIDYPVDTLVIIQNGPDDQMPQINKPDCVQKLVHIKHPNAGCAASWNEIITLFPAKWWLISNNDIQFMPGDLAKMDDAAEKNRSEGRKAAGLLLTQHHFSAFIITPDCVETVGLFDINFFPVYYEDTDYWYRSIISGVRHAAITDLCIIHGENGNVSCTVKSDKKMAFRLAEILHRNAEYYSAKWGGINGSEKYMRPFNNPNASWDDWRFSPHDRAGRVDVLEDTTLGIL